MLFNSAAYMLFLPVVVILYWLLPFKFRTLFLVGASYFFYMSWKPIYGLLILGLTVFNYFVGLKLATASTYKKLVLTLGIVVNLAILAYFKYTYMAIDSANYFLSDLAHLPNKLSYPINEIILPLGISFFVFEFIHYLMEINRGKEPIKGPLDFALFPAFFPTQIAGPIKRYQDFVPQLKSPRTVDRKQIDQSIELILAGLCKKVLLADSLAVVVDKCLTHPELLSSLDLWFVFTAFTFQLYFDFTAYTDIARGSASLMGFSVPKNFDMPFLSGSTREFWRRWHISLSTWLRDYLFIPLGGSRGTLAQTMAALFITMTVSGLWHGAGFHFVLFGAVNGLYLMVNKFWRMYIEKESNLFAAPLLAMTKTLPFHCAAVFLTFYCWVSSLIFFRVADLGQLAQILPRMFWLAPSAVSLPSWALTIPTMEGPSNFIVLPLLLLALAIGQIATYNFNLKHQDAPPGLLVLPKVLENFRPAYLAGLALLLLLFAPDGTPSFIYFQF